MRNLGRITRDTLLLASVTAALSAGQILQFSDVQRMKPPEPGKRIAYGSLPDQFGDLRVPNGSGPFPVVVLIHGGCWLESINLDNIAFLASALVNEGYATWSIEYRRVGTEGGGWPGTFDDVLAGFDHLKKIAPEAKLDLSRVVLAGHSAGGHLALWAAGKRRETLRGVVSLSGVPDLRAAASEVCGGVIPELVGDIRNWPLTSPAEMLPLRVPQWIVTASLDGIVPKKFGEQYAAMARKKGDSVELVAVKNAGHFELIIPTTAAYAQVRGAIQAAFGKP